MKATTCPVCKTVTNNDTEKYCPTCGEIFWRCTSPGFQKILERRTSIQEDYFGKIVNLQNLEKLEADARQLASTEAQNQSELAQLEEQLAMLDTKLETQKRFYADLESVAIKGHELLEYMSFFDTYLKEMKFHRGDDEIEWSLAGTRLSICAKTRFQHPPPLIIALCEERYNLFGVEGSRLFINLQKELKPGTERGHWTIDLRKIKEIVNLSSVFPDKKLYFSLQSEHQETDLQLKIEFKPKSSCPFPR